MNLMLVNIDTQCIRPCSRPCKGGNKTCLGKCINIQKVMLPKHLEQMHSGTTAMARVRGCRKNSAGGGGEYKGHWKKNDIKYEGGVGGFQSEVQVESDKRRGQKKEEETERLSVLRRFLGQGPAPLAETKWLAGIWCNLHLSAKSWILFLWSRCWRARRKAQLTGLHSWDRCLWPIYRGSSAQSRATTLIGNSGDAKGSLHPHPYPTSSPPIVLNQRKKGSLACFTLSYIVSSHEVWQLGKTWPIMLYCTIKMHWNIQRYILCLNIE